MNHSTAGSGVMKVFRHTELDSASGLLFFLSQAFTGMTKRNKK